MRTNFAGGVTLVALAKVTPCAAMANLTVDAVAGGKTLEQLAMPALDSKTELVVIQVEGANVRYTEDGTTAPVNGGDGFLGFDGGVITLSVATAKQAKFIQEGATPAKLKVGQYVHTV